MAKAIWGAAILAACAMAVSLAGCQTMSEAECQTADWRALGYQDAANSGATRFQARQESCARRGIPADFNAYQVGQAEGLRAFCQPARAFQFALGGGSFGGACPSDLAMDFNAAFSDGRRIYEARAARDRAQQEIDNLISRRNSIDNDIRDAENALSSATTDEDRRRHRDDIERLRRERRDTNDDLRTAQMRLPYAERALDDLRYEIGGRWGAW